jgi:hypothetical protein
MIFYKKYWSTPIHRSSLSTHNLQPKISQFTSSNIHVHSSYQGTKKDRKTINIFWGFDKNMMTLFHISYFANFAKLPQKSQYRSCKINFRLFAKSWIWKYYVGYIKDGRTFWKFLGLCGCFDCMGACNFSTACRNM